MHIEQPGARTSKATPPSTKSRSSPSMARLRASGMLSQASDSRSARYASYLEHEPYVAVATND